MYWIILRFTLTFLVTHIFFTRFILCLGKFFNRLLQYLYINYRSAKLSIILISIRSLSKCDTCVLIEYFLFMNRATQNNTDMNINMYKNNINFDYFKNTHCVINTDFLCTNYRIIIVFLIIRLRAIDYDNEIVIIIPTLIPWLAK